MGNEFAENRNFWGLDGVIGRRDFIINCLIIEVFEQFVVSIVMYAIFINDYHNLINLLKSAGSYPQWYYLLISVIGIISSVFYYSNFLRRLRDISEDTRIQLLASILTLVNFVTYLKIVPNSLKWISIAIIVFLAVKKGSITSNKPVDAVMKFNWGAFVGTWFWGIFNKSWITFLMLPLALTTAGFPFMLICGLKGNEWAYKNKKYDDVEKFHKSQSNQSILWIILTPIIFIMTSLIISASGVIALHKLVKTNPNILNKLETITQKLEKYSVESMFSKIDIEGDEYKFYIDPEAWKALPNTSRFSFHRMAVLYVMAQQGKSITAVGAKDINDSINDYVNIANKTKIYSEYNNEVLAEFELKDKDLNDKSKSFNSTSSIGFERLMEIQHSGFKQNNFPTIP